MSGVTLASISPIAGYFRGTPGVLTFYISSQILC
jgi:hypothetical protein